MSEKELSKEIIVDPETEYEFIKTVTETTEPRYIGEVYYDSTECEMVIDDIKENNKIWATKNREGFDCLNTGEDWEPEGNSVEEDIALFQKYLDETYGKDKYEAYAIGAYIHSGVAFAFNKTEDRRCRWDSGTIGFIGINKEMYIDKPTDVYYPEQGDRVRALASNLTEAWEGSIQTYEVWDTYENETVECISSIEHPEIIDDWKEDMQEKYGVAEYKQQD